MGSHTHRTLRLSSCYAELDLRLLHSCLHNRGHVIFFPNHFSCCLLPAQAERLEWLHAECTGRTVKADVAVADAFALPYREGTCDGVLCIAVLHHIASEPRRLRLLQQLAHILRPGKSLTLLLAGP